MTKMEELLSEIQQIKARNARALQAVDPKDEQDWTVSCNSSITKAIRRADLEHPTAKGAFPAILYADIFRAYNSIWSR